MKTRLLVALMLASGTALADSSMEERLRTQLRSTTQQLQALQSEQAQSVAARGAAESQLGAAQAQIKQLTAELAKARGQVEQAGARHEQLLSAAQSQAAASTEQVGKFKQAYEELLGRARAVEGERSRLAGELATRESEVQHCSAQNQTMYELAREVLDAYENVGVAQVVKLRQPFAGGARVKFEELAQVYADRLYQTQFDASAAPSAQHP